MEHPGHLFREDWPSFAMIGVLEKADGSQDAGMVTSTLDTKDFATKADIAILRAEMDALRSELKADVQVLDARMGGLESKMGALELKMESLDSKIVLKLGGIMAILLTLTVAVLRFLPEGG